jgi:hypothetical protein
LTGLIILLIDHSLNIRIIHLFNCFAIIWLTDRLNDSHIKIARRLIFIAMIIWILSTFHMLIFYNYYTVRTFVNTCSSRLVFIQYLLVHFLSSIWVMSISKVTNDRITVTADTKNNTSKWSCIAWEHFLKFIDLHLCLYFYWKVILFSC